MVLSPQSVMNDGRLDINIAIEKNLPSIVNAFKNI